MLVTLARAGFTPETREHMQTQRALLAGSPYRIDVPSVPTLWEVWKAPDFQVGEARLCFKEKE